MDNRRHGLLSGRAIAPELIGDHPPRRTSLVLHHLTEETKRCAFVLTLLNQNVDRVIVLIDCAPEIATFSSNRNDRRLIHEPGVTQLSLAFAKLVGVLGAELSTPLTNRLVRDDDASLCQQIFDVSETQGEAMVRPHSVTNNPRWVPVTTVAALSPHADIVNDWH